MGIVLAIVVGILVGIVVGALGAGGGILSVPILVFVLHQPAHAATAESLIIVVATAIVALWGRRKAVRWGEGLLFGGLTLIGAIPGGRLQRHMSATVLLVTFGVLLICVGLAMLRDGLRRRHVPPGTTTSPAQARWGLLIAAAIGTGLLTGFFGVGGGFIVVPVLVLALGFDIRRAAATSLVVIVLASCAGLLGRLGAPLGIDWGVTLAFVGASMLGGALGGPLSSRAKASTLTFAFAGLLLVMGVATVLGALLG